MTPAKTLTACFGLLPLLAAVGTAQHELVLKDHHHVMHGEVVSSTEASVTFEHVVGETSETQAYSIDQIDPHSFYIIRKYAVGDDVAAKVSLGEYCMANGLYTRARNQFEEARRLDASLKLGDKLAQCREGTASQMLAQAQALLEKKQFSKAYRKTAEIIRVFGNTPSGAKAREMMGTIHDRNVSARKAREAAYDAKEGGQEIKHIEELIGRAGKENTEALQDKSISGAQRGFGKSINSYKHALKELEGVAKQYKGSPQLTQHVEGMLAETKEDLIEVYLNLGSIYMTQTNYQRALLEANSALAVDPNSPRAKSFRASVATASGDTDIGVYPIRRVRLPIR